ncbi:MULTISPECIES: DUF262 domain-containing protein [Spirulina sp. CCY15215]|uniref:DUF262 domain-containing protein n=1 Tax=Spirulina sp. CCY15215 TaxID=2767591 RepID=UPI00194FB355|nr:DUF262 domain-containing protein [Spirulina major]
MDSEEQSNFKEELIQSAEKQIIEQSKRIEFYLTEYTIEILALKMRNEDFYIPAYQRDFTWEEKRRSRFIESILMGLPIPFLFFWENPATGKLEIVDGVQRLKTIEEFIIGDFVLGDLEELSLLSGLKFDDLLESRQRKIKNRSIRGIVLNEHTNEQSRFDLFERINTGSKIANKAEVRRGALGGVYQDLVISLSKEEYFIDLAPTTKKRKNEREREELVTRFFAYGDGLENYKDRVSAFLYDYTKKMNAYFTQNPEEMQKYRKRFRDTMEFVSKNFPWGFRRTATGIVTPRSRFEAIAIGSYLALQQKPDLVNQLVNTEDWSTSQEFRDVTGSDGANVKKKLIGRINYVRDRLLGE